jgi:hypothetical protein
MGEGLPFPFQGGGRLLDRGGYYVVEGNPRLFNAEGASQALVELVDCPPTEGPPAQGTAQMRTVASVILNLNQKRWSMYAHICPSEGLTWDDVCQLWDNGVYTAEDIKSIALLYFEGAELSAVLEVVEKVENDTLEEMNTGPRAYLRYPAAMRIDIGVSEYSGFEDAQNRLETDCDTASARGKSHLERAWRGLH